MNLFRKSSVFLGQSVRPSRIIGSLIPADGESPPRTRRHWFLFLLLSACLAFASRSNFVTLVSTPAVTVAAGKPTLASFKFRVANGLHINSNQPRSDLLIPTRLKLNPPTDVGVGSITYPPGQDITLSFAPQEKLNVYSGDFIVKAALGAVPSAVPGRYRVHGDLAYQACDDRACYPPQKLPLSVDVTVVKSRLARSHRRDPAQSPHIHN